MNDTGRPSGATGTQHPRAALITGFLLWALAAPLAAEPERVVLRGARLIDGRGDAPLAGVSLVIEGERIVSVRKTTAASAGTRVIDLGGATLLPGLIDAHTHPLISTDSYQIDQLRWSSAYKALKGLKAVQDNLLAGWTTLRIAGDADRYYAHLDIRRAIDEGMFVGPRITGAGHYLSVTGGGGDINFLPSELRVPTDGKVVDGVDEMRRAVREEIKYGSDWIKLLVTGAFMSTGDRPEDVHMSPEELRVAVEEAARRGVPVMAHAHGTEGIKQAIRAGVRSIEHGTFMDDEAIDLMIEHDVFLVPTVYIGEYYIEKGSDSEEMEKMVELSKSTQADFELRVAEAVRRGVKVAVGTDFGGYPPRINAGEISAMVRVGMTPMQAIQAATRVGAELLGWEDRVGTLEPGKLADVIAVAGNPLDDVSELEDVIFVMIGGRVVKAPDGVSVAGPTMGPR
ncbi:MAG: amidohydrolase family protein [bacterium]|nr:amidohydrolase family protein [bacterium]